MSDNDSRNKNSYHTDTANEFLKTIVIPAKYSNIKNVSLWALRDTGQNFILTSDSFANQLGYSDHTKLISASVKKLPFFDKNSLIHSINQDVKAIEEKKIIHSISVFKIENKIIANISSIIPIFFKNEVVALEIPSKFLDKSEFNLELFLSVNSIELNTKPEKKFTQNETEDYIIYLMILKKTQQQIAKLLDISRSRVSQRIGSMCYRMQIPGYSAKLLIEYALAANYHREIPPELFFLRFDNVCLINFNTQNTGYCLLLFYTFMDYFKC